MEQADKALSRRIYEEVLNKGNLAAVDELFAPDLVVHAVAATPPPTGTSLRDSLKQTINRLRTIYPDLHYTIEDQIAEGDKVVTRWTRHGTQTGEMRDTPFGTIAPTGKEVTTTGISIHRFVNGKIAEMWLSQDNLSTFQQLGALPAPAPAAR